MPACRTCGASFTWRRVGEKWHAIDPDGQTNHWSYCLGRRLTAARQLEIRKGATITGKHYRPSCGRCDLAPWESCACSALLPIEARPIADRINADADSRLQLALRED